MTNKLWGLLKATFVASAVGSALLLAAGSPVVQAADDVVRIGVISPHSGAAGRYGVWAWRGAQMAADEINAAGGVAGKKVELFQYDDACAPAEGASAAQRAIEQDNVSIILGAICSSVTLAIQPIAESAGVLLVNAASSNPDITYKAGVGGFKWTFRNYPTDEIRALIVLQYATEQKGHTKYAVLSVDSDFGRGAIDFVKKYLPRFNAEIVTEDYYKDKEVDFRPVLAKIRESGATAIIHFGLTDAAPIIGRQMDELGLGGKIAVVGSGEISNPDTVAVAPTVFEGGVEAAAWLPDWPGEKSLAFVEDFKAKYGGESPNNHAYTHWETMHLLAAAMRAANSTDNDDIRQALESINYESVMGEVTFDDHNQANLPMILIEIVDGKPAIKGAFSSELDYPS